MSQTAKEVLAQALSKSVQSIVIISETDEGGLGISWSDMDMEKLVYLKDVFQMAVAGQLSRSLAQGTQPKGAKPGKATARTTEATQ